MANEFARRLRREMTDEERFVWARIRYRQLGGFRLSAVRHRSAGTIADFVCFEAKLILELDGSQHVLRVAYDAERTARLASQGFRVLRFLES